MMDEPPLVDIDNLTRLDSGEVAMTTPPVHTPSVLFVCVHNAGRSQMAAGWLRSLH